MVGCITAGPSGVVMQAGNGTGAVVNALQTLTHIHMSHLPQANKQRLLC
jgi:hypothetical protein